MFRFLSQLEKLVVAYYLGTTTVEEEEGGGGGKGKRKAVEGCEKGRIFLEIGMMKAEIIKVRCLNRPQSWPINFKVMLRTGRE